MIKDGKCVHDVTGKFNTLKDCQAGMPHTLRTVAEGCVYDENGEYASLALEMIRNGYLNGEVVRLDGSIRMAPR